MSRALVLPFMGVVVLVGTQVQSDRSWIEISNGFTEQLLVVEMKHHPEVGSKEGLSEYDSRVSQPTRADEDAERKESESVLEKFKVALAQNQQEPVAQDLRIMIRRAELDFKLQDFQRAHKVPFINASGMVYEGIRVLLDDQTPEARRPAAVVRIREYAGLDPNYKSLTEILKQRVQEQMVKPGILYPARCR